MQPESKGYDTPPAGEPARKKLSPAKVALLCLLAAVVTAAVVAGVVAWNTHHNLNFGCVEPGILYRCGQPGGSSLRGLVEKYGIKTVVNLRSAAKIQEDREAQEEISFATRNHVNLVFVPVSDVPTLEQVREFLDLVKDPANRPVLIHCAGGKERSGMMVAVYRIVVDGWPEERALKEMISYGYDPRKKRMWKFVQACAVILVGRPGPPLPTPEDVPGD